MIALALFQAILVLTLVTFVAGAAILAFVYVILAYEQFRSRRAEVKARART